MRHIQTVIEESGFVRLVWRKSDGGIHMQGIAPGESVDTHLAAVNADMASRRLEQMSADDTSSLKASVEAVHTAERIAAFRAAKVER